MRTMGPSNGDLYESVKNQAKFNLIKLINHDLAIVSHRLGVVSIALKPNYG